MVRRLFATGIVAKSLVAERENSRRVSSRKQSEYESERVGRNSKCSKTQTGEDGYLDDRGNGNKMVTEGMKIETVGGETSSSPRPKR